MSQLLIEMVSWIGYLERPVVLVQIILIALICLGLRILDASKFSAQIPQSISLIIGPVTTIITTSLLRLTPLQAEIIWNFGFIWLGWNMLSILQLGLIDQITTPGLNHLVRRLFRPVYLFMITLAMINRLDSMQAIAVIKVGQLFGVELTIGNIFTSLISAYLLIIGSGPPSALISWVLQKMLSFTEGSRKALELIIRYSVIGIGITAIAFNTGLNTNALLAIAGGLSLGIGFGLKEMISNFVSGIWLLFEGSVRPGEVLMVDGDPCEVRKLGLRATWLWRDRDNAEIVIPNQTLFTTQATSYTSTDRLRRSEVKIRAGYQHDPKSVLHLLEQTALSIPSVLRSPAPRALQIAYGESAIEYSLRFWIANPMTNIRIISEVNQAIWATFNQEGIEIPLPERVEYIREWPNSGISQTP